MVGGTNQEATTSGPSRGPRRSDGRVATGRDPTTPQEAVHARRDAPATPHLTAWKPRVLPTPTIAPVIVCVVETGMPSHVAP